ncbi:hypothetical protein JTB14_017978 [Gonioctena quinquepunctata]|nr:hypothetical protein JTB14_017978 [Gonioctena quinquepunctata]
MEKEKKEKEKEMRRVARAQKMKEKEEKGKTTTSKRKTTKTVSKAGKKYKKGKCGVKDREGWIKCSGCSRWAHEACAGCDDDRFVCEYCL